VGVIGQAVEDGVGVGWIGEHGRPFAEGEHSWAGEVAMFRCWWLLRSIPKDFARSLGSARAL
jgi:hypothetical protein